MLKRLLIGSLLIGAYGSETRKSIGNFGLACVCGSENFERVVVQRKPAAPIVTDFVACVECSAMYWSPPRPRLAEFSYDKAYGDRLKRTPGEKG